MAPERKATGDPKGAAKPKAKAVKAAAPAELTRRSGRIKAKEQEKDNDEPVAKPTRKPPAAKQATKPKPAPKSSPKSASTKTPGAKSATKPSHKRNAPAKKAEALNEDSTGTGPSKRKISDSEEGTDVLSTSPSPKKSKSTLSFSKPKPSPSFTANEGNKKSPVVLKDSQDSSSSIEVTKSSAITKPTSFKSPTSPKTKKSITFAPGSTDITSPVKKPTSPKGRLISPTRKPTSPTKKPTSPAKKPKSPAEKPSEKPPTLRPTRRSASPEKSRQGSPGTRVTRSRSPKRKVPELSINTNVPTVPSLRPLRQSASSDKSRQGSPGTRVTRSRSPERKSLVGHLEYTDDPLPAINEDSSSPDESRTRSLGVRVTRSRSPEKKSLGLLGYTDDPLPDDPLLPIIEDSSSSDESRTRSLGVRVTRSRSPERKSPGHFEYTDDPLPGDDSLFDSLSVRERKLPTAWNRHKGKQPASQHTIQNDPSQASSRTIRNDLSQGSIDEDEANNREGWRQLVLSYPGQRDSDPIPDTPLEWEPKRPTPPPIDQEGVERFQAWSQLPPPKELLETEGIETTPSQPNEEKKKRVFSDINSIEARLATLTEARKKPKPNKYDGSDFEEYTRPNKPPPPLQSGFDAPTQSIGSNHDDPDSTEARRAVKKAQRHIEEAKASKLPKFMKEPIPLQSSQLSEPSQPTSMPPPDRSNSRLVEPFSGAIADPLPRDADDKRRFKEDRKHVKEAWQAVDNGTRSLQSSSISQQNPRPPTPRPQPDGFEDRAERFLRQLEEIIEPPPAGQPSEWSNRLDHSMEVNTMTVDSPTLPAGVFTSVLGDISGPNMVTAPAETMTGMVVPSGYAAFGVKYTGNVPLTQSYGGDEDDQTFYGNGGVRNNGGENEDSASSSSIKDFAPGGLDVIPVLPRQDQSNSRVDDGEESDEDEYLVDGSI